MSEGSGIVVDKLDKIQPMSSRSHQVTRDPSQIVQTAEHQYHPGKPV